MFMAHVPRGVVLIRLLLAALFLSCTLFIPSRLLPTDLVDSPLFRSTQDPAIDVTTQNVQANISSTAPSPSPSPSPETVCPTLPGSSEIVIALKTGATELYSRLPTHLLTLATCFPGFLVFSDMAQSLGPVHVYDALTTVGARWKETHEDFDFYRSLQAAHETHQDLSLLSSEKGWAIDKWKNIPMLAHSHTLYPDAPFHITIDADTYLSPSNLLHLLATLSPHEPHYIGSSYIMSGTTFAQGGTGYILSQQATAQFMALHSHPSTREGWEERTSHHCCGDVMLSTALADSNVSLTPGWPLFNSDPPLELDFHERNWCKPPVTFHHVQPFEVEALWQFEMQWLASHPFDEPTSAYLYKDVFAYFVLPAIRDSPVKERWDNLSQDRTFTKPSSNEDESSEASNGEDLSEADTSSPDACALACERWDECRQWTHRRGFCGLHSHVRLGRMVVPKKGDDDRDNVQETVSGWLLDRIETFMAEMGDCSDHSEMWKIG